MLHRMCRVQATSPVVCLSGGGEVPRTVLGMGCLPHVPWVQKQVASVAQHMWCAGLCHVLVHSRPASALLIQGPRCMHGLGFKERTLVEARLPLKTQGLWQLVSAPLANCHSAHGMQVFSWANTCGTGHKTRLTCGGVENMACVFLCYFWETASAGWRDTRLVSKWMGYDPKAIARVQALCCKEMVHKRPTIYNTGDACYA